MVKLSIIILSYNTKELVLACIDSLIKFYKSQLEDGEFEVIVCDNASEDGTIQELEKAKSPIKLFRIIKNQSNLGYSKGNNFAARRAMGEYLLFLNSDTQVLDKGLLKMIDFLEKDKKIAVLGARLVDDKNVVQNSVGKFYSLINVIFLILFGDRLLNTHFAPAKTSPVDWVMGASMMVRKEIYASLGGFDEYFFMYVEDMEFCFRLRKMGYEVYYYSDVSILHSPHGSSNRSFAIVNIYKSLPYYYSKHHGYIEYLILKLILRLKSIVAISIGLLTNNKYLVSTYKRALRF